MSTQTVYRQTVLAQLRDRLDTIRSFGVQSLALFGAVARDEATEASDLDFLVEFEGAATFVGAAYPQGIRYMDLKFFLEDFFGKPVDLVTRRVSRGEATPTLKPQIADTVLAEVIYL